MRQILIVPLKKSIKPLKNFPLSQFNSYNNSNALILIIVLLFNLQAQLLVLIPFFNAFDIIKFLLSKDQTLLTAKQLYSQPNWNKFINKIIFIGTRLSITIKYSKSKSSPLRNSVIYFLLFKLNYLAETDFCISREDFPTRHKMSLKMFYKKYKYYHLALFLQGEDVKKIWEQRITMTARYVLTLRCSRTIQ